MFRFLAIIVLLAVLNVAAANYAQILKYSSGTCSGSLTEVDYFKLASCTPNGNAGDYFMFSSNSGGVYVEYYSDSACATSTGAATLVTTIPCGSVSVSSADLSMLNGVANYYYEAQSDCTSGSTNWFQAQLFAQCTTETPSYKATCYGDMYNVTQYSGASCSGTTTTIPLAKDEFCANLADDDFSVASSYSYTTCVSASSSSSDDSCFSGNSQVQQPFGLKMISDLNIGDEVLSFSSSKNEFVYSPVVAIPHEKNSKSAIFQQIETSNGKTLQLTPDHLIPVHDCDSKQQLSLVKASSVNTDNCVASVDGIERVVSNEKVHENGIYTVVTMEDMIVVDGVVVSPFALNHFLPNLYYNIHRMLYRALPKSIGTPLLQSAVSIMNAVVSSTK